MKMINAIVFRLLWQDIKIISFSCNAYIIYLVMIYLVYIYIWYIGIYTLYLSDNYEYFYKLEFSGTALAIHGRYNKTLLQ